MFCYIQYQVRIVITLLSTIAFGTDLNITLFYRNTMPTAEDASITFLSTHFLIENFPLLIGFYNGLRFLNLKGQMFSMRNRALWQMSNPSFQFLSLRLYYKWFRELNGEVKLSNITIIVNAFINDYYQKQKQK